MNRSLSNAWTRLGACTGLAALLGACAVQSASPNDNGHEDDSRTLAASLKGGQHASQRSPIATAPSTCERDRSGALVTQPDTCSGAGASRVLVRLGEGARCDTVLDLSSSPDVRVSRQFPDAPEGVRDRFCAFDAINGDAAMVPALLASLCALDSVSVAVHDCHVAPAPAAFPSEGYVTTPAPMHVFSTKQDAPVDEPAAGPHSCDTCGFVDSDMLYINIPLSMVTTDGSTMIVRSLDAEVPDRTIQPPAGAQSFVVPQIGLPDASPVRLYAPGQVPPPKQ